jgi:hypothetical protein
MDPPRLPTPFPTRVAPDPANNAHAETIRQGEWAGFGWDAREHIRADQSGFKGGYLNQDAEGVEGGHLRSREVAAVGRAFGGTPGPAR